MHREKNLLSGLVICLMVCGSMPLHSEWNSPENGNPILPGYTADPSIFYDSASCQFYIYSTTDGVWISYSADPQVAYSADCIHWKFSPLVLPTFWPSRQLWAPTAMRHPTNGKYYLMYCIGNAVYIAYATTPFGPWMNAVSGEKSLYSTGQLTGSKDWIDPQFFIDESTVYFTFGQQNDMGIARLTFDPQTFMAAIDDSDSRMSDGVKYRCKKLIGLSNNLEGSCMFKKGDRYYITYSNSACQNYNVRYAVASSPVGPFTARSEIIVQRNDKDGILGPGHNSILQYGGDFYICYHRQHYPYIDVKRQTCIDHLFFDGDNLRAGQQTTTGISNGTGELESLVASHRAMDDDDLAFGKKTVASSESAYKGGTSGNIKETFTAQSRFYKSAYAVDRNNATRWAPEILPGYLIVDLGNDYPIGHCETTFELIMRRYRYRIEYLASSEASDITAAEKSSKWQLYADRSENKDQVSPVMDSNQVITRYMKVTLLSADLPTAGSEISTILQTDYADRASIFEFKVFGSGAVGNSDQKPLPIHTFRQLNDRIVSLDVISLSGQIYRHIALQNHSCPIPEFNSNNPALHNVPPGIYIVRFTMSDHMHMKTKYILK